MFEEKKCCGFDPYPGKATFLGVLTLAYPALVLALLCGGLLRLFGRAARRHADTVSAVAAALFRVVNAAVFPGLSRAAAARLYRFSPAAAGLVYRRLNFLMLSAAWAAALSAIWRLL